MHANDSLLRHRRWWAVILAALLWSVVVAGVGGYAPAGLGFDGSGRSAKTASSAADGAGGWMLPKSTIAAAAALAKTEPDRQLLQAAGVGFVAEDRERAKFFVGLKEGYSLSEADLEGLGLHQTDLFPQTGTVILAADEGVEPDEQRTVAALLNLPGIEWAELSSFHHLARVPNDEKYALQWAPPHIRLPQAWDVTTGSRNVVVAVLDSGIAQDIVDLSDRIVSPYSTKWQTASPWAWEDIFGHGSGVAGIAVARGDNRVGMAGTAWDVSLMPVHFTDDGSVSDDDYIRAIYWAVDHGADVINISYGSDDTFVAERRAIEYALNQGAVVVASAGNGGQGAGIQYPAALPGVIAVGATDRNDLRASFSSTGLGIDLVAPGKGILTYDATKDSYGMLEKDGTSFATPFVSGIAALLLSVNPSLTSRQVADILTSSAVDLGIRGFDTSYGHGRVDAGAALGRVGTPTTGSTTTTTVPATTSSSSTTVPTTTSTTTTTVPVTTTTTTTTTLPTCRFSDVPAAHPYWTAIEALAAEGVVCGRNDGTFGPDEPVLRAQFAKMICGVLDLPVSESLSAPYRDLGPDDPLSLYPHQYVAAVAARGITVGVAPGLFAPWRSITRAQVVTMIVRAAGSIAPGSLRIPPLGYTGALGAFDLEHGETMRIAEYNGLLSGLVGYGSRWDPWQSATRGEVADVLWHLLLIIDR